MIRKGKKDETKARSDWFDGAEEYLKFVSGNTIFVSSFLRISIQSRNTEKAHSVSLTVQVGYKLAWSIFENIFIIKIEIF